MTGLKTEPLSRGWLLLAGVLMAFELLFIYEAMLADIGGYQKIFGVFLGLAILCFASILYAVKVIFYD